MNKVEIGLTRTRGLLHGPKAPPLAQHLNLWSLQDGALVGVNLDFSTVYEVEPENVFLMDPAKADLFATQARAFLNSLPPETTLQLVVQVRQGDARAVEEYRRNVLGGSPDELSRLIVDKKTRFIEGKFVQRRRFLLYLTSRPKDRKAPMTWLLPVYRKPLGERARDFHQERLREHSALDQLVT